MSAAGRQQAVACAYQTLLTAAPALPVEPLSFLRTLPDTQVLTFAQARDHAPLPYEVVRLYESRCEGVTVILASGLRLVLFQGDGAPGRRRFTLAHELGHCLLGHAGEAQRIQAEEAEADLFAAHLLMPVPLIRRLKAENRLSAGGLARLCQVSQTAARTQLGRACVAVDPALLRQVTAWAEEIPLPPDEPFDEQSY